MVTPILVKRLLSLSAANFGQLQSPCSSSRALTTSGARYATLGIDALDRTKSNRERVVILGSGWAGYTLAQRLSNKFQTVVISPRNYFVFTPLLNSAAVGTLEFRLALEPVRSRRKPNVEFMQGWADDVNFQTKTVTVEETVIDQRQGRNQTDPDPYKHSSITAMKMEKYGKRREGKRFDISYDKLVVAVGCYSQTFGTKGVKENAYFMKDVGDARGIRKRVLECFEIASLPTTSEKLREQLLRFAIVGGGPTGMEFAAEISDLIHEDLSKIYPRLVPLVKIAVHDVAPKVLSMFDENLAKYAMKTFSRQGVQIKTQSHIEELRRGLPHLNGSPNEEDIADAQGCFTLITKEEGEVGIGMCVWSTGNMVNPFVKRALRKTHQFPSSSAILTEGKKAEELPKQDWMIEKNSRTGAIVVDEQLRVQLVSQTTTSANPTPTTISTAANSSQGAITSEEQKPVSRAKVTDVYALGDNANMRLENLPATAQTANQQAIWLAKEFNAGTLNGNGEHGHKEEKEPKFSFRNMGIMAYVGDRRAIVDTAGDNTPDIAGRAAWLVWRGAYMTKSISWRNRILIPTYWFLNWLFGRDITRF